MSGGNPGSPKEENKAEDRKGKEGGKQEHPHPPRIWASGGRFPNSRLPVLLTACTEKSPGEILKGLTPKPHPRAR